MNEGHEFCTMQPRQKGRNWMKNTTTGKGCVGTKIEEKNDTYVPQKNQVPRNYRPVCSIQRKMKVQKRGKEEKREIKPV